MQLMNRASRGKYGIMNDSRPSSVAGALARLSEVVESVLALSRSEAGRRSIALSADLQTDPELDGAKVAPLKEILLNLVFNALQAIKLEGIEGINGRAGEVKVACATNGEGSLIIAVSDNGAGVPLPMQDKIFEPFFTTKTRGTGLGLAIVARRVRELGGTITLMSPVTDECGARFEITLPSSIEL
jgi:signal transduction histidine kinase